MFDDNRREKNINLSLFSLKVLTGKFHKYVFFIIQSCLTCHSSCHDPSHHLRYEEVGRMQVGPLKGHCTDLEGNEAQGNGDTQEY